MVSGRKRGLILEGGRCLKGECGLFFLLEVGSRVSRSDLW